MCCETAAAAQIPLTKRILIDCHQTVLNIDGGGILSAALSAAAFERKH